MTNVILCALFTEELVPLFNTMPWGIHLGITSQSNG